MEEHTQRLILKAGNAVKAVTFLERIDVMLGALGG